MNIYVSLLIIVPVIMAMLFLLSDNKAYYRLLSYALCAFGIITSILLAINGPVQVAVEGSTFTVIEGAITILEIAIIAFLFWVSYKHKRWHVFSLTVIQTILFIYATFFMEKVEHTVFNVDTFSIVMLLLVNVIGTLILVFANGYMNEYEHHRHMKSRQKLFYFVICIFLAAMNGLVMSDSLNWIYFFWEITTLSSFMLISYNQDTEAFNSGFKALFLNLIGGLCFSIGNIIFANSYGITSLSQIIQHGSLSGFFVLPVFLLCIAGFAKSAQMPFQSWLLGAMVAPTPVSALLHSSTMVKAGVYLIVKLSPAYAGTSLGTAIAVYGGFTFLICSAIAISQSNAKRVLAYSTIANLGLIICSAGIGTSTAVAAAIILIIFHAISKALLFLCTGQIEHTIGSRDIEDMTGLIHIAPVLSLITVFGLLSMILPPFGVLVTKLVSLEAAASNPFIAILIILGSALTTLYYIKWMGSVLAYPETQLPRKKGNNVDVYLPLSILSVLVLLTSIFIAPLFNNLVLPELSVLLPKMPSGISIARTNVVTQTGAFNNDVVFIVLAIVVVVGFALKGILIAKPQRNTIYMCGENNLEDENMFRNPVGAYEKANVSNLYLSQILNEKTLTQLGSIISLSLIVIVLLGGLL